MARGEVIRIRNEFYIRSLQGANVETLVIVFSRGLRRRNTRGALRPP